MDSTTIILIAGVAAVVIALAVVAFVSWNNRRRERHLQETFGAEYDTTYASAVNRKAAVANLKSREERVSSYEIHPLSEEQRRAFAAEWQNMQASFVDHPSTAVNRADLLLAEVMRARGYETDPGDDTARIEDVSVGHGEQAAALREAAHIAKLNREGKATTEDLRRAIKDYGVVFDALLNEAQPV